MPNIPFVILDVFATGKYSGNQLAVCFEAGDLTDLQMQQIAREINFSETTFITHPEPVNGGYNTRIFTPTTELPFAGHPTLGTAFAIDRELISHPIDPAAESLGVSESSPLTKRIVLNYKVGQIPVDLSYLNGAVDILWMHQQQPKFYEPIPIETLAAVIGVNPTDIDARYPIEPVSTGLPCIIMSLKTMAAVSQAKLNLDLYYSVVSNLPAQAILVFCPETIDPDRQLHVRVFTEYFGIPEDPATGSANGCLAAYLAKHQYFGSPKLDITVEQGIEMGRPSVLYLRSEYTTDTCAVSVGGRVVKIAQGEFIL